MKNIRCHELAVQFYRRAQVKKLPCHLRGQLQRASSSVALNISEGWGRATPLDRRRFFQIAFGSIREVQSIVQLEPDHFTDEDKDLLDHMAASVYKLIRHSPGP